MPRSPDRNGMGDRRASHHIDAPPRDSGLSKKPSTRSNNSEVDLDDARGGDLERDRSNTAFSRSETVALRAESR